MSGSHFCTLSHGTVLPSCFLNLRDTVSPQQAVTSGLWEVISLPFCLLRQAWIRNRVLNSTKSGAPKLDPAPQWVPWCIWGPCPDSLGGRIPCSGSSCLLVPGWISSQQARGCTLVTREVVIPCHLVTGACPHYLGDHPHYLDEPPSNVGNYELRYKSLRQIIRKQCLLCQHKPRGLASKGWAPGTKGSHLIYLIWLNVTSLAISLPQCYVTFMFQFFNFYLSALPSPPLV
jgi:hypothetical protein